MIVSIDRALKELINIKCSHKSGALIQKDWCLLEEEEMSDLSPHPKAPTCEHAEERPCENTVNKRPGSQLSSEIECQQLDLGLPASRTVRK